MKDPAMNVTFTEREFDEEAEITEEEIKEVIGILANRKAAGEDGIPIELLKTGEETKAIMAALCNCVWKSKQWAKDWSKSIFVPIFKKGDKKLFKLPYTSEDRL